MATNLKNKYTGTLADYQTALAEYQESADSLSYWEQLLQPSQTQYTTSIQTARQTAGYDITNAYKSYLQQQQAIEGSNLLGTSAKTLQSAAENQYAGSYATAQSQLYSDVGSAYETFQKNYATTYEQLTKEAEYAQQLDEYILKDLENNYENYGFTEEEANKMYSYNTETGQKELTQVGKLIYATALQGVETDTESEYFGLNPILTSLKENNKELYEYYLQNQDRLNKSLFDIESDEDYKELAESYKLDLLAEQVGGMSVLEKANAENVAIKGDGSAIDINLSKGSDIIYHNEKYKVVNAKDDIKYLMKFTMDSDFQSFLTDVADNSSIKAGEVITYDGRMFLVTAKTTDVPVVEIAPEEHYENVDIMPGFSFDPITKKFY